MYYVYHWIFGLIGPFPSHRQAAIYVVSQCWKPESFLIGSGAMFTSLKEHLNAKF